MIATIPLASTFQTTSLPKLAAVSLPISLSLAVGLWGVGGNRALLPLVLARFRASSPAPTPDRDDLCH
jgi:hypothetical protein